APSCSAVVAVEGSGPSGTRTRSTRQRTTRRISRSAPLRITADSSSPFVRCDVVAISNSGARNFRLRRRCSALQQPLAIAGSESAYSGRSGTDRSDVGALNSFFGATAPAPDPDRNPPLGPPRVLGLGPPPDPYARRFVRLPTRVPSSYQ